ncbi:hypothetical protein C2845_PM16G12840 [Panicum miliaceum]|uniref:Uncharacterized protein n=1 Tax=Panicum miliaceum TaxID=4540 RepID=A0A3L6PS43_PANMI|nr:hypothetical protein C2845_PM16G12840 [Panicum miliaceum]
MPTTIAPGRSRRPRGRRRRARGAPTSRSAARDGAEKMCHEVGVPFLGKVPMDPQLGKAVEEGRSCFTDRNCSASALALKQIMEKLVTPQ